MKICLLREVRQIADFFIFLDDNINCGLRNKLFAIKK